MYQPSYCQPRLCTGPYRVDLIGGPYLETVDSVCKALRPKTAQREPRTGA